MIDAGSWEDSRFGDRHFTFWETPEGTPVSMAALTSVVGGMVRVDPVYTPAHLRGRGYAGAVTVGDCLDITGARWGLAGAEAVLRLRTLIDNDDFNSYWRHHTAWEHQRLYPAPDQRGFALSA